MTSVTGTSTIPKRPLFEGGPEVSVIGFGAWPIGGGLGAVDADVGLRAVQVAVDVGQSFIDTAEYYERAHEYGNKTNKQGGSETVIGRALTAAPSLKEQAFVTTKCTLQPYTEEKIRSACAYSMEKLQADCIELYQLHGWDPATPVADQLGVLAALQEEGKINYIGLKTQESSSSTRRGRLGFAFTPCRCATTCSRGRRSRLRSRPGTRQRLLWCQFVLITEHLPRQARDDT